MAVHRIGRTLLLDELDIQELFMRSSQVMLFLEKQLVTHFFNNLRALEILFLRKAEAETQFSTLATEKWDISWNIKKP